MFGEIRCALCHPEGYEQEDLYYDDQQEGGTEYEYEYVYDDVEEGDPNAAQNEAPELDRFSVAPPAGKKSFHIASNLLRQIQMLHHCLQEQHLVLQLCHREV